MPTEELFVDLVLRRPASVVPKRWTEALMEACCKRLVPGLESFSISDEQARISVSVGGGQPSGALASNLAAVASVYAGTLHSSCTAAAPAPENGNSAHLPHLVIEATA
jgi:hypothetical protein